MTDLLGYLVGRFFSLRGTAMETNITSVPTNEFVIDKDDTRRLRASDQEVDDPNFKHLPVQREHHQDNHGRLGYFSLPGEVRNKIMRYSLIPGQIQPRGTSSYTPKSPMEKVFRRVREPAHVIFKNGSWSAKISKRLPELLILLGLLFQYIYVFHPEFYVGTRLIHYMCDVTYYVVFYLCDWNIRRNSRQISWREFPDPMMEYLYEQLSRRPSPQAAAGDGRPIPQLLATCKQAYLEGHVWFYTRNMFFLPRGPLSITHHYFGELQEQHRSLIQAIGIRLGLQDLTAEDLDLLESHLDDNGPPLYHRYPNRQGVRAQLSWSSGLANRALYHWTRKLGFVRSFTTLKHVRVESAYATVDLDGSTLRASLKGVRSYTTLRYLGRLGSPNEISWEVQNLLEQAYTETQNLLSQRVRQYGWISTKRWLSRGADGQM